MRAEQAARLVPAGLDLPGLGLPGPPRLPHLRLVPRRLALCCLALCCLALADPPHQLAFLEDLGGRRRHRDHGGEDEPDAAQAQDERQQERARAGGGRRAHGQAGDGLHPQRRHAGVVHAADRHAHDQGRDQRGPQGVEPQRGPQRRDAGHHRDEQGSDDERRVVAQPDRHPDGRHAEIVHAGHADPEDQAAGQQRPGSALAEADDERPDPDHEHRDQHGHDGEDHVVADGLARDGEPEHGDEVHHPDPRGGDGQGARGQPAGPGRALVRLRAGGAAEPEEAPYARHEVGQDRVECAIREVIDMNHGGPLRLAALGYMSFLKCQVRHEWYRRWLFAYALSRIDMNS